MIPAHIAAAFPESLRERGRRYQRDGRVQLVHTSPLLVQAMVQGTRLYHVQVAPADGALSVICTCPFAQSAVVCKHVWATLLEADALGQLPDDLFEPDDDTPASVVGSRWDVPGAPPSARATAALSSGTRVWKRQLGQLRQHMVDDTRAVAPETWPADRRLIYVVDVPATVGGVGLMVELATERRLKDGSWDRPRQFSLGWQRWTQVPDAQDRQIAQMLVGARSEYGAYSATAARRFMLPESAYDTTLRAICDTGRCRLRRLPDEGQPAPLAWDDGGAWTLRLRLVSDDGGDMYQVRGHLRRDDQEMALGDATMLLAGGLIFARGMVARFEHGGAFALVPLLRADTPLRAAASDAGELLRALYALPHLPPLDLPPKLGVVEAYPPAEPRLTISAQRPSAWTAQALAAELAFAYEGTVIAATQPDGALFDVKTQRVVHRDRAAEEQARQRLHALGFRQDYDHRTSRGRLTLPPQRLDAAVGALTAEGWHVEADGRLYRHAGARHAQVRSGVDWFELDAAVEFDGQRAPLPQLLAALRRGERSVVLDDGSLGLLPEEWLRRYAPLAGLGTADADGRLRFTRTQAGVLDAMLAAMPEVRADETFERVRTELREFDGIAPADAPPGFTGALRPYQREGLGWLHFLRRFGVGGCLADDMGLGKTVQVLALLEARRAEGAGPSLVVVPKSLVFNWQQEAERFAPALRVVDYTGAQRQRALLGQGAYDLMLTTYGTLRRDAAEFKDVEFDYVVLDEAQAIKNAGTASAKAARLLNGRHRLALSGTPVENRLDELWSLFEFLNPGMLGAASAFKLLGAGGMESDREAGRESRLLLGRALRPYLLRRTKQQVARDLPEKLEQTIYVDLPPRQRKLYDELRDHYRNALHARVAQVGIGRAKIQILEALLRLRQAACHPGLLDKKRVDEPGGKLEVLLSKIAEVVAEQHKVLVFSQFTSLLALVRTRLDDAGVVYEYLDGRTHDRQARVERFQTDLDCPVFLISLKAGGQGLNLTAADYVFLLDPWWNPAVEAQAVDRAHRIGQTRRVFAARLIARDTVEEKVLELQRTKRDLADAILTADNGVIGRIGREELELLLG